MTLEELAIRAIDKFGIYGQIDILQEECAELIQALSKLKRAKEHGLDHVIEEMTHVLISIEVNKTILCITQKQIDKQIMQKAQQYNLLEEI